MYLQMLPCQGLNILKGPITLLYLEDIMWKV